MKKTIILCFGIVLTVLSCEKERDIINEDHTLPIIKLTIDEKYLWSPDSGLYVVGTNGKSFKECPFVANYNQKWEFPAKISYLINNIPVFEENVGFRIKGTCSRNNPMKSIGIYWKNKYGNEKLEYPVFPNSSTSVYKRLFLRNSGNDFGRTHIKDAAITQIIKDYAKVDFQEYEPCVLYLNEEYWGIHNIREMLTPHHFQNHYGVNQDTVDLLEGSELDPYDDDGTIDDFVSEVINFIQAYDLADETNFEIISDRINIDSYIDYIIINTYICNADWPVNNAKWWRDKTSADYYKWKWIVYDTDFAFKINNIDKVWIGELYGESFNIERNGGFFIFNNLIKNEGFKEKFLERYQFFINTVFEKVRVENIIRQIKVGIEDEYPNHQKKWNTLSKDKWEEKIEEMIEFNNKRNDIMREVIKSLIDEKV